MNCANCPNEAAYLVADPGANPVSYCRPCLPAHLQVRADAGHFPLPEPEVVEVPEVVEEPAPKRSRKVTAES